MKVSGGSAGRITINLDLSDSYSGLKAQVLVRKAGSKTFTVLGTVTLGEAGEGKVSSKTAVAKGSVLRVVIGGKIVKTITR